MCGRAPRNRERRRRLAGLPSGSKEKGITFLSFVFVFFPTVLLMVMTVKRGIELGMALSRLDKSYTYPTHLKSGVFLSAASALVGGPFILLKFRAPIHVYCQFSARDLLFRGIGFLTTAAGLGVGTALEATFVPRSFAYCNDLPKHLRFLDAMTKKNVSSKDVCQNLVFTWALQLAMLGLYGVIGFLALGGFVDMHLEISRVIAGRKRYQNRLAERFRNEERRSRDCTTIEAGHATTPNQHNHPVHAHPTLCESEDVTTMDSISKMACTTTHVTPATYINAGGHDQQQSDHYERICVALSAYEILENIATYCTCVDLKSLMTVSRGVRHAILGASSPKLLWQNSMCGQSHMDRIRDKVVFDYSPEDSNASNSSTPPPRLIAAEFSRAFHSSYTHGECIGCAKHVCKSCSTIERNPMHVNLVRHLLHCRPSCGPCFEKYYCRRTPPYELHRAPWDSRVPGPKYMPPVCNCSWNWPNQHVERPKNMQGPIEGYTCYSHRASRPGRPQNTFVPPPTICKHCVTKSDSAILSGNTFVDVAGSKILYWNRVNQSFASPETSVMAEVIKVRGYYCLHCEGKLLQQQDEVIWWVCTECKGECITPLHRSPT